MVSSVSRNLKFRDMDSVEANASGADGEVTPLIPSMAVVFENLDDFACLLRFLLCNIIISPFKIVGFRKEIIWCVKDTKTEILLTILVGGPSKHPFSQWQINHNTVCFPGSCC